MLIWLVLDGLVIAPLIAAKVLSSVSIALLTAILLAIALAMLRRGALRKASLTYLCVIWTAVTVVILLNGGITSPLVSLYISLAISAGCAT